MRGTIFLAVARSLAACAERGDVRVPQTYAVRNGCAISVRKYGGRTRGVEYRRENLRRNLTVHIDVAIVQCTIKCGLTAAGE